MCHVHWKKSEAYWKPALASICGSWGKKSNSSSQKVFGQTPINRRTVRVDPEKFATSVPGIFAVGDINDYPGKKKLILSGFHETALAAFAIQAHLQPGKKVHLQYTTTSPIMHRRLGVAPATADADQPERRSATG